MRQIIEAQARSYIVKLHEYFEQESLHGGPLLPVARVGDRVAAALGVSRKTICKILKEKYGSSGMEDNELKTPNKKRKRRKEESTKLTITSDNSEDDEPLLPESEDSASHGIYGDKETVCDINNMWHSNNNQPLFAKTDSVSENSASLQTAHKIAETDFKRHSFFAITHSEGTTVDRVALTNHESQKDESKLQKKGKQFVKSNFKSDPVSISGAKTNLDKLNAFANINSSHDESVMQDFEIKSINPNLTIDPLSNSNDSTDFDASDLLINPNSLVTEDTVTRDQRISETGDDKKRNDITFDENKMNYFKIFKSQSNLERKDDLEGPSNSMAKIPVEQQSSTAVELGTGKKSIAKADFQIGRLKVQGIANETVADVSERNETYHPEAKRHKPAMEVIDEVAIRNHVKEYHNRNQYPTIRTLLISLKSTGLYNGNKIKLMEIMGDIGFKFNRKPK